MPEGPETVRAADNLKQILYDPRFGQPYLYQVFLYGTKHLNFDLQKLYSSLNSPLTRIETKGKHYFLIFASGFVIRAHHGMSGYWSFGEVDNIANVHLRIDFSYPQKDGTVKYLALWWVNERFGKIEVLNKQEYEDALIELGNGFIGDHQITPRRWHVLWKLLSSKKKLRSVLMDQHELCSGIGNYLVAEIFYEMKLHPETTVGQIPDSYILHVYQACKNVVQGFYEGNRSKVVYNKRLSPKGNPIENYKASGRTMWWCPSEQYFVQ